MDKTEHFLTKYRTALMGAAILWIMLFHSGIPTPENTVLRGIWYIFVSFGGGLGVNLFVLLSGMGLMLSSLKKQEAEPIGRFYSRKMIRLFPAYLFVAILFYFTQGYAISEILYHISFTSFFAEGVRDFWYIALMIAIYLLFPLFAVLSKKIGIYVTTALFLTANIVLEFLLYCNAPEFWENTEVLVIRMLCFFIGCLVGHIVDQNDKKTTYIALAVLVLVNLCFLIPIKFNVISCSGRMQRYTFVFLSVIVSVVFTFMLKFMPKFINSVLSYFGKRSLEIYLVHVSLGVLILNLVPGIIRALILYFALSILIAEILYQITNKNSFLIKKLKIRRAKT